MLPTQQDWLLNKRFQPTVCSACLLLPSVICLVWQPEEGQEPENSTFICASSSDSEEICVGLLRARRWADVTEKPDRSSQFCLCFVTDRGRDVVTLIRGLCVQSTQASTSCLLLQFTEHLYNPWQCRMRGQYHGITALPAHKAIIKLKKPPNQTT